MTQSTDQVWARRPANMSGSTFLTILHRGDEVRAAAYGTGAECIPVIEIFRGGDRWDPLVSWKEAIMEEADAEQYAAACIAMIRGEPDPRTPLPG